MKQTLKLGNVAGIAIGLHWSVLVLLVLVTPVLAQTTLPSAAEGESTITYWAVAALVALLLLGSLLAHELSHALVARHYKVPVGSITLWALGGVADIKSNPPSPKADLRIAGAGPLASLMTALIFLLAAWGWAFAGGPEVVFFALGWLAITNTLLAVFNMLPGAPLDGGRVLRAFLWKRYGDRVRAEQEAAKAGRVLGMALITVGIAELLLLNQLSGLWLAVIGWFIVGAAKAEEMTETLNASAEGLRLRDIMTRDPACGAYWQQVDSFVAEVVLVSRQTVFPVIGFAGEPIGIITLDLLAHTPTARVKTTLGAIALPLPAEYVCGPDDPVIPLFGRRPIGGELMAVVLDGHQVQGIVTTEDTRRLIRQSQLKAAKPAMLRPETTTRRDECDASQTVDRRDLPHRNR